MSALKVYYVTLKKLADEGNAEAALALRIGENIPGEDFSDVARSVCRQLTEANDELGNALSKNDRCWTAATDRCIERARAAITQAFSLMAQR